MCGLNDAVLFPVLPSRNKIVALGNKLIKATAKSESWEKAYEENFYTQYLKILNYVAKELNSDISTIEMLLFAKAEELALLLLQIIAFQLLKYQNSILWQHNLKFLNIEYKNFLHKPFPKTQIWQ